METLTWVLIALCITQSAIFSGLNLSIFSISKLQLEIEVANRNKHARRLAKLRKDSNYLLVTILWGNISVNVLLSLLSDSVMAGVFAFIFSTVVITMLGEILPQAYFSRHAFKMASLFSPLLNFYRIILYPVAKPTAILLNKWLGPEAITYFKERDLRELVKMHMNSYVTDIGHTEGWGILNFLSIDDLPIKAEGEEIHPQSVISMDFKDNRPVFPKISGMADDAFLKLVNRSGKKWVIVTDASGQARSVLDADGFLRDAFFKGDKFDPYRYCHRPIILKERETKLGDAIPRFRVQSMGAGDDVIDKDIIVLWDSAPRIITGSDILGRLLRGIVQNVPETKKQG